MFDIWGNNINQTLLMMISDKLKYGDVQRIKTVRTDWGYQFVYNGETYDIFSDGSYWYAEDSTGNTVAEGQTKKECVISLQFYLNLN